MLKFKLEILILAMWNYKESSSVAFSEGTVLTFFRFDIESSEIIGKCSSNFTQVWIMPNTATP